MQEESMFLPLGTELHGRAHDYVIEDVLGHGTFGITYKASVKLRGTLGTLKSNVYVAIKEFYLQGTSTREGSTLLFGSQADLLGRCMRRFRNEAIMLSKLDHTGIVKVLEAFEENATAYYVMELIEGQSLSQKIDTEGQLSGDDCVRITVALCDALEYMHAADMLHLDLKPSNVMIRADGSPVLIDFGLSRVFNDDTDDTFCDLTNGTYGYSSLEQAAYNGTYSEDDGVLPVTMDIYSLGATMFRMITGDRPPGASVVLNKGLPLKKLHRCPQIEGVIVKAMKPMVSERYRSMTEMRNALPAIPVEDSGINHGGSNERGDAPTPTWSVGHPFVIRSDAKVISISFKEGFLRRAGMDFSFVADQSIMGRADFLWLMRKINELNITVKSANSARFFNPMEYSESPHELKITAMYPGGKIDQASLIAFNKDNICGSNIVRADILNLHDRLKSIIETLNKPNENRNSDSKVFKLDTTNAESGFDNLDENASSDSKSGRKALSMWPISPKKKWAFIVAVAIIILIIGIFGYCKKKQNDEENSQQRLNQEMSMQTSRGMFLLSEAERLYDSKNFISAKAKADEYFALRAKYDYLPDTVIPWLGRCDTIIKAQQAGTAITPDLAKAIEKANKINPFSSGLAVIRYENGEFAVIDTKGKALSLEGRPSRVADSYSQGYLCVGRENGFYLDTKGKLFRPANSIDYEDAQSFDAGGFAKVKGTNGKFGLIDKKGHEVIPLIYNSIGSFTNGFAAVSKDGKYGYVNKSGIEVVAPIYDCVSEFKNGYAFVRQGDAWYYINSNGKQIAQSKNADFLKSQTGFKPNYSLSKLDPFGSNLYLEFFFKDGIAPVISSRNTVQFINTSGNIVYSSADSYKNYLEEKKSSSNRISSLTLSKPSYTVFKEKIKIKEDNESSGLAKNMDNKPFSKKQQMREIYKYGLILDADTIFPAIFDSFQYFDNGFYIVRKDNKWGYADKFGASTFDYTSKSKKAQSNQPRSNPQGESKKNDMPQ